MQMQTSKLFWLLFALSLLCSPSIFGVLTLEIDPLAKEFSISGSGIGTPNDTFGAYSISWTSNGNSIDGDFFRIDNNQRIAWTTDTGSPGTTLTVPGEVGHDTRLFTNPNLSNPSNGSIGLVLYPSVGSLQTITGLGSGLSYASLSANNQAAFESLIGQTMSLSNGTSFGDLQVIAIPEPHFYGLLYGFTALFLILNSRHKF